MENSCNVCNKIKPYYYSYGITTQMIIQLSPQIYTILHNFYTKFTQIYTNLHNLMYILYLMLHKNH